MSYRQVWRIGVIGVVLIASLASCGPEAGRPRGAGYGTGADPGNHPPASEFQPRSKVFPAESEP